jgi:hypothetical protein
LNFSVVNNLIAYPGEMNPIRQLVQMDYMAGRLEHTYYYKQYLLLTIILPKIQLKIGADVVFLQM